MPNIPEGQPVLDEEFFDRLFRVGGHDLVRNMIDAFLSNAPRRIAAAERGLAANDLDATERAVHSLKSTSGNLGGVELQLLAERVEALAAARDPAGVAPLIPDLAPALARLRERLLAERPPDADGTRRLGRGT